MAIVVQTEAGRQTQSPIGRQVPGNHGRQIVGGIVQAETVAVPEAAVHLDSGNEIFRTQITALGAGLESQRTAHSHGISKLPDFAGRNILGDNRVLRDIPSIERLRQEQLAFDFVIVKLAGRCIGLGVVRFHVVAFDFLQDFVGGAGLLVFDVEHRVDEVFTLQQAKAILPAKSGEDRAVIECGLSVKVDLGGPPGGGSVFEFGPECVKVIAAALRAEGGEVFDLEAPRLFQIVVVGDDVGALLRVRRNCSEAEGGGGTKLGGRLSSRDLRFRVRQPGIFLSCQLFSIIDTTC